MRGWLVTTALLMILPGCHRGGGAIDAGEPAKTPPQLVLAKDRKDLLFTYVDAEGKLHDVDSAGKVPEERRKQVLVRDLSKNAEELKADQFVYLVDLTRDEGGVWPYTVASRYSVDRSIRDGEFGADDAADAGDRQVVLYGTSWCGACAQARAWLKSRAIPFVDKDVEADARAAAEMQRKMKRAGLSFGGVPVIDVAGRLVVGFDARQVERLLKGHPAGP